MNIDKILKELLVSKGLFEVYQSDPLDALSKLSDECPDKRDLINKSILSISGAGDIDSHHLLYGDSSNISNLHQSPAKTNNLGDHISQADLSQNVSYKVDLNYKEDE